MKVNGQEFVIIGENVHTTRILLRKGKRVTNRPDGAEAVEYADTDGTPRYLVIPEFIKKTRDYDEGRVKHVKIAVLAAMSGVAPEADEGLVYIQRLVERQLAAGADFLDLNVDEVSLDLNEQKAAMRWLVETVEPISSVPLSVDSSNIEIIEAGLQTYKGSNGRTILNSASLERVEALDLAKQYDARVIATAAGKSGMPQDTAERIANASQMVDTAVAKGIPLHDIFVDPLVFPISVDSQYGNHCLDAIRQLREKYGPEIHITGGFSNVSFGLPCRHLINDVFIILAVDAGADAGIVDPVASPMTKTFAIDRNAAPVTIAERMLTGHDQFCADFLTAFRKGELKMG